MRSVMLVLLVKYDTVGLSRRMRLLRLVAED
jgi:hypothetical protein